MKTAPFDLQKALAGHPLVTRGGEKATNFRSDNKNPRYPYSCAVGETRYLFTDKGSYWLARDDQYDLFLLLPDEAQFPEPPKGEQWHNPHNLTPEQVNVSDGWRLLLESELDGRFQTPKKAPIGMVEFLNDEKKWDAGAKYGNGLAVDEPMNTYRTKEPLPKPKRSQQRDGNGRFVAKPVEKPAEVKQPREILPLVIADLCKRGEKGIETYGVPLTTHNGRNALVDAYEEVLDTACYLRQAIEEQKGN